MKLDFRTKLCMTVVLSYVLLVGNLQEKHKFIALILTYLPSCLFCISGYYKKGIKNMLLLSFAYGIQYYLFHYATGVILSLFLFFTIFILRMIPPITMGMYTFMTTDMCEVISALKKMRVPIQIIIPITVIARFFYTVKIDYTQIQEAMYLHGLTVKKLIFKPMKLYEYQVVPLLMLLMRTADEVSISAMTRGFSVDRERSSIGSVAFHRLDYFVFLCLLGIIYLFVMGV